LHIGLRVADLDRSLEFYRAVGYEVVGQGMDGDGGFSTRFIADPDGRRIELVQWPAGHADGLSAADWAGVAS
jgi:lactoylglutathione lyase